MRGEQRSAQGHHTWMAPSCSCRSARAISAHTRPGRSGAGEDSGRRWHSPGAWPCSRDSLDATLEFMGGDKTGPLSLPVTPLPSSPPPQGSCREPQAQSWGLAEEGAGPWRLCGQLWLCGGAAASPWGIGKQPVLQDAVVGRVGEGRLPPWGKHWLQWPGAARSKGVSHAQPMGWQMSPEPLPYPSRFPG